MSDFVTELRREVVTAHAAHRVAAVRTRRRRRRPLLAGAVALAALLVAVVWAVRSVPPPEQPTEPRVVKVLRIGGDPADGAFGAGSLWVTDFARRQIVRIDPARRAVIARIALDEPADEIAADDRSVWARGDLTHPMTRMWRIDPRSNRVVTRSDGGSRWFPAMADGAVWVAHELVEPPTIDRLSPAGRPTARIRYYRGAGLAGAGRWLWVVGVDGAVLRIDARRGRIAHRWPRVTPQNAGGDTGEAVVADEDGAWVLDAGNGRIVRFEGDRIVRVLRIDDSVRPTLAATRDGLWVVTSDEPAGSRLARYDPRTGKQTATVDLGAHSPRALVPTAGGLWVVAGDGSVVLVAG